MFAVFGEILFQLLVSPTGVESTQRWTFAEHAVVEDKPQLQWTGDGLQTLSLDLAFHRSFTDPAGQLGALLAAASDHSARALVFGNGEHHGYFVIIALKVLNRQFSAVGDLIAAAARVELKEWVLASQFDPNAPPLPQSTPIGLVLATGGASAAPVTYTAPVGITSTPAAPTVFFTPPSLAAPGVSSVLNIPGASGATSADLLPGDVAPQNIVRGAA